MTDDRGLSRDRPSAGLRASLASSSDRRRRRPNPATRLAPISKVSSVTPTARRSVRLSSGAPANLALRRQLLEDAQPRGRRPSTSEQEQEEEGVDFYHVHISEGMKHMRLRDSEKALGSFLKAEKKRPEDTAAKMAISRCYLQQSKLPLASQTIDQVVSRDAGNVHAMQLKAEILYQTGDFEQALYWFEKARSLCPTRESLKMGANKARQAATNGLLVSDANLRLGEAGADRLDCFKRSGGQAMDEGRIHRRPTRREKFNYSVLLGDFYKDYMFLKDLLARRTVTDPRTRPGSETRQLTEDAIRYLETRVDFWERQNPLYNRPYDFRPIRKQKTSSPLKNSKREFQFNTSPAHQYCKKILEKIDILMDENQWNELTDTCADGFVKIDGYSDNEIEERLKKMVLCEICLSAAFGFYKLEEYESAIEWLNKTLAIAEGMEEGEAERMRALAGLAEVYSALGQVEQSIALQQQTLAMATHPTEQAGIAIGLARSYLQLDKMEDALGYTEEAIAAASEPACVERLIEAHLIAGDIEGQLGNYKSARDHYNAVLELTERADATNQTDMTTLRDEVEGRLAELEAEERDGGGPAVDQSDARTSKTYVAKRGLILTPQDIPRSVEAVTPIEGSLVDESQQELGSNGESRPGNDETSDQVVDAVKIGEANRVSEEIICPSVVSSAHQHPPQPRNPESTQNESDSIGSTIKTYYPLEGSSSITAGQSAARMSVKTSSKADKDASKPATQADETRADNTAAGGYETANATTENHEATQNESDSIGSTIKTYFPLEGSGSITAGQSAARMSVKSSRKTDEDTRRTSTQADKTRTMKTKTDNTGGYDTTNVTTKYQSYHPNDQKNENLDSDQLQNQEAPKKSSGGVGNDASESKSTNAKNRKDF